MLFGDVKKWYKLLSIVIDAYICGGYFCSILNVAVTSRARVWIEICCMERNALAACRHFSCEGVD